MSAVDKVRNAVRDHTKHPVLELEYVDHGFNIDGNMVEAQHGTFVYRKDYEGSKSAVHVVTMVEGSPEPNVSGFPVELIPQVVEHLQAIYKGMQQ